MGGSWIALQLGWEGVATDGGADSGASQQSVQHLETVVLLETQIEARCTQVEARYGAGFEEASLELGRHTHTGSGRMKWREGGRKPGEGVEPEAKGGARASKSKKSALARSLNPLSNNPSP